LDKELVGIAEEIRRNGIKETPTAILTRGLAGISKKTIIVNLPGSPKGALSSFKSVKLAVYHAIEIVKKKINDCKESIYLTK